MSSTLETLHVLAKEGVIAKLDFQFASFIAAQASSPSDELILAAAATSNALTRNLSCFDLAQYKAGELLFSNEENTESVKTPNNWEEKITIATDIVASKDSAYNNKPLILSNNKLYLSRYFHYENSINEMLCTRAELSTGIKNIEELLEDHFSSDAEELDQKQAAKKALQKKLTVITGGPGTGKTTCLTKILAMLEANDDSLRIALTAPTGKAAMRLADSILGKSATTIHRLLGYSARNNTFKHSRDNKLSVDVIIIDEASMIGTELMYHLLVALPDDTHVLLVGDAYQLASVEAGQVFADICSTEKPVLRACISELLTNFRFDKNSGIAEFARLIREHDTLDTALIENLKSENYLDLSFYNNIREELPTLVVESYKNYLELVRDRAAPEVILEAMNDFQVLCALREGPYGVSGLNILIEQSLTAAGLIKTQQEFYIGRPIMITQNDYALNLFNGDAGVCLRDPESTDVKVFFRNADGGVRGVSCGRLPAHESCYAMTVHKSQGSEFDRVALVLNENIENYAKELLYTGATRAKSWIGIFNLAS
jgi:exodeoxyribonuclease V alpha subunit